MDTTTTKKCSSKTAQATKKNTQITEEHIRKRAFEIYLERGAVPGQEVDNWHRAENELKRSN